MSSSKGGSDGYLVAVFGAVALAAGLWLPWYTVHIPASFLQQLDAVAGQSGLLGQYVQQGAAALVAHGPIDVSAWHAFTTTPAALLALAVAAGGLSLLTAGGRAGGVGRLVQLAGLVGVLLVGYRILSRPADSSIVHLGAGIFTSLAGAVIMLAGGALASSGERLRPAGRPADSPRAAPPTRQAYDAPRHDAPDPNWMRRPPAG